MRKTLLVDEIARLDPQLRIEQLQRENDTLRHQRDRELPHIIARELERLIARLRR